jgi:hypothetical protein
LPLSLHPLLRILLQMIDMHRRLWVMLVAASVAAGGCVLAREGTSAPFGANGGGPSGGSAVTVSAGSDGNSSVATGGGASTTNSGGGSAMESDCLNGIDDDGDGDVDCGDNDCVAAGFVCLPPLAGAASHVVLSGNACPAAAQPMTLHSCDASKCACDGQPGECTFQVARWNGNDCNGQSTSSLKTQPNCYSIDPGLTSSFKGTTTSVGNASCLSVAPDIVAVDRGACEVSGGACANGGACVPAEFPVAKACVLLAAGSNCMAPYDGYRTTVYDNPNSSCNCSCSKVGESCAGSVQWYSGNKGCNGPATGTTSIDGQCKSVGYLQSYSIDKVEATPQCQADASMPSGEGVLCCMKGL